MSETAAKTPSAEELQQLTRDAFKSMFNCEPPEDKSPPKREPSPDPTVAPVVEASPATPPADKVEPPAEPAKVEPAVPAAEPPQPATPPSPPTPQPAPVAVEVPENKPEPIGFEMGKDDKADYEALLFLEQQNPEKYSGKAAEFAEFVKKNYAYQDDWLAKNPGKDFNSEDEEHAEWYAANQPKTIDREIIDEAKDDIRIERMVEKRIEPIREEYKKEKAKKAFESNLPVIASVVNKNLSKMVELASPELVQHLKDANGNISVGKESVERVRAADPIAARELEAVALEIEPLILDLEKTAIPELEFALNPAKNPVHAEIQRHLLAAESDIRARPAAEQIVDGKKFATMAEYTTKAREINRLPAKERQSKMAEYDASVWTVSIDDVESQIVKYAAEKAKKIIGDIDSAAKRKYGKADPTAQPAPAPKPNPAQPDNGKPRPPSIRSESDALPGGKTGEISTANLPELATQKMFG